MSLMQTIHPLNTKMTYIIQKGKLPADARNSILESALTRGIQYLLFFDDDVLFPDITIYRMWVNIQKHPEAGVITGVYGTKLDPVEPFLYTNSGDGAYWDWPLGALIPIHSAGAGCMIVNLSYVQKLSPPWFDDQISTGITENGQRERGSWGHDRYFMHRLAQEAGARIYADTGLLLAHWDTQIQKFYLIPPDATCFQQEPVGEAFIPAATPEGTVSWRRVVPRTDNTQFLGYLEWLGQRIQLTKLSMMEETALTINPKEHTEMAVKAPKAKKVSKKKGK